MNAKVFWGRIEWYSRHYRGELFHSVFCDPPYNLSPIEQRFGKPGAAPAQYGRDGAFSRLSSGFMGKSWDSDVAFNPEVWAAIRALLYPGAFGIAFAGTRGYHRMATAIEAAGFIIHPAIGWLFGSGLPKGTRIDNQIADQELAEEWAGHRYGLQAMKPAFEFICLFQNPYVGRPIENMIETGAGALNIEATKIPSDGRKSIQTTGELESRGIYGSGFQGSKANGVTTDARVPANFILDRAAAPSLDAQSGETTPGNYPGGNRNKTRAVYGEWINGDEDATRRVDTGGASRYFYQHDWAAEVEERIALSDPFCYEPKSPTSEREAGLAWVIPCPDCGKYGSSEHLNAEDKMESCRRNNHPTIKPIGLTEYLARLLLPPARYAPRRVLIPFSGTGSEQIGALRAGWEVIQGVELTRDYVEIARHRLHYWSHQGVQNPLF